MPQLEETLLDALAAERRISEERALLPGLLQHDLANVLQQITTNVDLLVRGEARPEEGQDLVHVQRAVHRLGDMVKGMKYLHMARGGETDYTRDNLAAYISDLVLTKGIWPKGAAVTLVLPAEMWCTFSPALIQHALLNLVGNAIAYSHNTWVRVRLERTRGERWQIAVANGGPGIPEKHLPYLFSLGRRAGVDTKSSVSGLGLYIARQCVRDHGSELRLRTKPGKTVFAFTVEGSQRAERALPKAG